MNVDLLRKIKKHILAEPARLYMFGWIIRKTTPDEVLAYGEEDENTRPFAKCGTAACIAGWAAILSKRDTGGRFGACELAPELLGLTSQEAARLCIPRNWPLKFRGGCADDGKAKTAKLAARRIEHFIKTKGAE